MLSVRCAAEWSELSHHFGFFFFFVCCLSVAEWDENMAACACRRGTCRGSSQRRHTTARSVERHRWLGAASCHGGELHFCSERGGFRLCGGSAMEKRGRLVAAAPWTWGVGRGERGRLEVGSSPAFPFRDAVPRGASPQQRRHQCAGEARRMTATPAYCLRIFPAWQRQRPSGRRHRPGGEATRVVMVW